MSEVMAKYDTCDEYLDDPFQPECLLWWLAVQRLPAYLWAAAHNMGGVPKLFADHKGKRVRLTMASRLGDVGITRDLKKEVGYENRVLIKELSNFSHVS